MKVLIVNNMAPFIWGGAEELAVNLQKNIELVGHEAEILRIPFQWEPATKIPSQMLMCRKFEIDNVDKVIALKFPAYLVRHPNKVLWLLHQYRQAYDLFDQNQTNLPTGQLGEELKQAIHTGDKESFTEAKKIFTISKITQQRLKHYNGFESEVLFPPLNDPELFVGSSAGEYLFAGGRVNSMKRQHLLIEALALTPKHVQLVIAGPPDDSVYAKRLHELAEKLGVKDRVKLDLGFLPRMKIADYVNNALACICVPFNEDFGYVAIEGAHAGKALIASSDSGGVLWLVKHNITGWITEPNPQSIANAMTNAMSNKTHTAKMGRTIKDLYHKLGMDWKKTVEILLS